MLLYHFTAAKPRCGRHWREISGAVLVQRADENGGRDEIANGGFYGGETVPFARSRRLVGMSERRKLGRANNYPDVR